MSDWIEVDGKKYYEQSYVILANENTNREKAKADRYEGYLQRILAATSISAHGLAKAALFGERPDVKTLIEFVQQRRGEWSPDRQPSAARLSEREMVHFLTHPTEVPIRRLAEELACLLRERLPAPPAKERLP